MKKAMLFVVSLLFSVSVSAASLTLSGGSGLFLNNGTSSAGVVTTGTGSETWSLTTTADTTVVVDATFNPDTGATVSIFDGVTEIGTAMTSPGEGATGTASFFAFLMAGTTYDFFISDVATFTTAIISAVPVPAALWLLGPALLGFFGLRRNAMSTNAVSA
jgi:hypothetical protein